MTSFWGGPIYTSSPPFRCAADSPWPKHILKLSKPLPTPSKCKSLSKSKQGLGCELDSWAWVLDKSEQPSSFQGASSISILSIRICYSWSLLLDGSASPVERPLVCERPGKFVLPRPLWTRASEYSILLRGGLGEDKGYRASRLFVSPSTEK
jgi:hypothetical protein